MMGVTTTTIECPLQDLVKGSTSSFQSRLEEQQTHLDLQQKPAPYQLVQAGYLEAHSLINFDLAIMHLVLRCCT